MTDATCRTCPYFSQHFDNGDPVNVGTCRRLPPLYVTTDNMGDRSFPVTDMNTDWCGEHPKRRPS